MKRSYTCLLPYIGGKGGEHDRGETWWDSGNLESLAKWKQKQLRESPRIHREWARCPGKPRRPANQTYRSFWRFVHSSYPLRCIQGQHPWLRWAITNLRRVLKILLRCVNTPQTIYSSLLRGRTTRTERQRSCAPKSFGSWTSTTFGAGSLNAAVQRQSYEHRPMNDVYVTNLCRFSDHAS